MSKERNYASFSTHDFICDEFFQDWIFHPDEAREAFWSNWIRENPAKKAALDQAAEVLRHLSFREHFPSDEQVSRALAENSVVRQAHQQVRQAHQQVRPRTSGTRQQVGSRGSRTDRSVRFRTWTRAAVFIGIVFLGYGGYRYWQRHARTTISTAYAQLKTVRLPDGSAITLNAHSSVAYPRFPRKDHAREVWLKGEAFFDIKHINKDKSDIKPGERFIVHAGSLDVEVLGTSFDVKTGDSTTKVMLKTGSIRLKFRRRARKRVVMRPGDLVAYNVTEDKLTRTTADAAAYTAWTERKMILKGASVKEIADYIEDFYGYHIQWADTTIKNKRMEGTLLLDSLPDVLFVISTALDIEIEPRGDTLIFKK